MICLMLKFPAFCLCFSISYVVVLASSFISLNNILWSPFLRAIYTPRRSLPSQWVQNWRDIEATMKQKPQKVPKQEKATLRYKPQVTDRVGGLERYQIKTIFKPTRKVQHDLRLLKEIHYTRQVYTASLAHHWNDKAIGQHKNQETKGIADCITWKSQNTCRGNTSTCHNNYVTVDWSVKQWKQINMKLINRKVKSLSLGKPRLHALKAEWS